MAGTEPAVGGTAGLPGSGGSPAGGSTAAGGGVADDGGSAGQGGGAQGGGTQSGGAGTGGAGGASNCVAGCLIDTVCHSNGDVSTDNACLHCDPSLSTSDWSARVGAYCNDGDDCTLDDSCSDGVCAGTPRNCDDNVSCNGTEACESGNCVPGISACDPDEICDHDTDTCATSCAGCVISGTCYAGGQTNPSNVCEICDSSVDGSEWTANDGEPCNDGSFCNGADTCLSGTCSVTAGSPCPDDGTFCNGAESCDEAADQCVSAGDPCSDNGTFCDGTESCDETANQCLHSGSPCLDDGLYCTGAESCNETANQCVHSGDPCADDGTFCNGSEGCDETANQCVHSGDPCADDGTFCNGSESCSETADQCVHSGDPCAGVECRENADLCCTPNVSLVCGTDGNVHNADACGQVGTLAQECPGDCASGACRCVIYLNGGGGSDSNTGLSWAAAKRSLQAAIDTATPNGCEVWTRGDSSATPFVYDAGYDRTHIFVLRSGVAVFGGFVGTETKRTQRDYATYRSILTGDVANTPSDTADDAYHVVIGANNAVLDGFTVTSGRADGTAADRYNCGGGLLNDGVSPTIRNCRFENNRTESTGGGICNLNGAAPRIENCVFTQNVALSSGGGAGLGIYNSGSSPVIVGCRFEGMTCSRGVGAGIFNSGGAATVIDSVFFDNSARDGGGGASESDGAATLYRGCEFTNNYSYASSGGGIESRDASPTIVDCTFTGNESGNLGGGGGALGLTGGSAYIINSVFSGNHATTSGGASGGAIIVSASAPTIINSLFTGNYVGGGTYGQGGAISVGSGGATIANCTFYGNNSHATATVEGTGGAVWISDDSLSVISNSIFFGNSATLAPDLYQVATTSQVMYTVVGDSVNCVSTCLAVDPQFVNAAGGDFTPQNSACVDSADASRLGVDVGDLDQDSDFAETVPLDLYGAARIQGSGLDMGAVEAQ